MTLCFAHDENQLGGALRERRFLPRKVGVPFSRTLPMWKWLPYLKVANLTSGLYYRLNKEMSEPATGTLRFENVLSAPRFGAQNTRTARYCSDRDGREAKGSRN